MIKIIPKEYENYIYPTDLTFYKGETIKDIVLKMINVIEHNNRIIERNKTSSKL